MSDADDGAVPEKTDATCNLSPAPPVGPGETMTASDPSRTRGALHVAQRIPDLAPRIRAFLRRLCGSGTDVDDLLQDVMERAIRYRHSFDPANGTLESWLLKTAFRRFLDHREKTGKQPQTNAEVDRAGPDVDAIDLRDQVGHALRQLTPIEQDIVLRFHHRRETIVEIAAALSMPEGTVKSHLHRARRKLAEADR